MARAGGALLVALVAAGGACAGGDDGTPNALLDETSSTGSSAPDDDDDGGPLGEGGGEPKPEPTVLDDRELSYNEALRTASLKLNDRLPTLAEIKAVANAADPRAAYEEAVDRMLDDPAFTQRMIRWWRDTLRQGGGALDTAPVFAARIVVEGRPYDEMFTATENTCPSYDNETNTFIDGNCDNGVPQHAGVLTNPGSMAQFYANMAFRRVRWVQEIFVCTKFPAEYAEVPQQIDGATFTSPWDFDSISSVPVDFRDTSSVVCANCHTTMNHVAPLFAFFDENGQLQASSQVMTPTAPEPTVTELSHWLPEGEGPAWRAGQPVANLPELGVALAEDPAVHECMVARMWNFTMSKEDIVSDLATVPREVIDPYVVAFVNEGMSVKETLRSMLKSEDFVLY